MSVDRRGFLGRALAATLGLALAPPASARGRLVAGGRASLRVPWPVAAVDPHELDDATAALFGDALFDGLYAFGASKDDKPIAALAESDPEVSGADTKVRLRAGLVTAAGRPLVARDVVASIARAKGRGGRALLADVPGPKANGDLELVFATKDAARLARALASPIAAIVPSSFAPASPDGTGPFRAERRGAALALVRNPRAARGPALLDELVVSPAADLAASLRAFEAGTDDVGWLGQGLHGARAGSKAFDAGAVGWAILRTGKDAASWDAPGVAQRLCDGLDPGKLAYLVLGAAWTQDKDEGWGGPACEIIVRSDSPWLVEVARAVAAMLGRPGHEVKVATLAPSDFLSRRASRTYALAVDVTRPLAPGTLGALAGLASADDMTVAAELVRKPPRVGEVPARTLTRSMRVGLIGEVRAQGGRVAELALPQLPSFGWDLGLATRGRP